MTSNDLKVFLCTANVGTIFEHIDDLLPNWLEHFNKIIEDLKPHFIALHMQEVGGKNYKQSMQSINIFFKRFLSKQTIETYTRFFIVVDSDFTDETTFTSLSNIYLVHRSVKSAELFNFKTNKFSKYLERSIFTGNLQNTDYIYKERFPKDIIGDFQWSRKGFIQTKWKLNDKIFDFANIHLFHDASNLIALSSSPSIYSLNRRKAFEYCTSRIKDKSEDGLTSSLLSIFGDFNFRLDLAQMIEGFANKNDSLETRDSGGRLSRLVCQTSDQKMFTIEDKKFQWHSQSSVQSLTNDLLKYDQELVRCEFETFSEFDIQFPPSYPFKEDINHPEGYMEYRCPAWCDRIVLNDKLKTLINTSSRIDPTYDMIGATTCMGDHKPIYLYFSINTAENDDAAINTLNGTSDEETHQCLSVDDLSIISINHVYKHLHSPATDLHDHALFKSLRSLNVSTELSTHYAKYLLDNLNILDESPVDCIDLNNDNNKLSLNKWFASIAETILAVKRLAEHAPTDAVHFTLCSSLASCSHTNSESECDCDLSLIEEKRNSPSLPFWMTFFKNELNGNFFKLKHLLSFLDELITRLNERLDHSLVQDDLVESSCFNHSQSSLTLLNEIKVFLNSPFVFKMLKSTVQHKPEISTDVIAENDAPTLSVLR